MSRMVTEQPRAVWCCSICGAVYYKDYPRCPADGGEVVIADRDPLLGSVVGHYTIVRLVGEGGMGRVYLAHHVHLPNKRYALKVLLGDHAASVAMRTRFTREAERASQLEHPNVVKVVDFGQTRHGLLYIVMEYVEGPSLASLIERGPMAADQVITLARGICAGLGYAHAAGIVHRDLKPENILVATGPDGPVPRIVDFGLALSVDQSDARLTETGMTMGTPAFAAPEQLSGKPLDQRADLYALGMTMFEMLTGGLAPVEGALLEVLSARAAHDVPRISERAPHIPVPRALEDIVARLTRKRPLERYASAGEVISAFDQIAVTSKTRWVDHVASRWRGRRWFTAMIGRERRRWLAAGAAAALAGVAVAWCTTAGDPGVPARPPAASAGSGGPVAVAPIEPTAAPRGSVDPATAVPGGGAAAPAIAAPAMGATAAAGAPPVTAAPATAAGATPAAGAPKANGSPSATGAPRVTASPAGAVVSPSRGAAGTAAGAAGKAGVTEPPARRRNRPRAGGSGGRAETAALTPAAPRRGTLPSSTPARPLRAEIAGIDVAGSLPAGAVQRAIERRWAAIARCIPPVPEVVVARFTIGEARRAQDIRATGSTAGIGACITAALSDVRTEAAPDVGDVQVTVRIAFVGKP